MITTEGVHIPEVVKGEVSWFLGIMIDIHPGMNPTPHFRATYEDLEPNPVAEYEIESLALLNGGLTPLVHEFVIEWASLHKSDLMENWQRAINHQPLLEIDGLE